MANVPYKVYFQVQIRSVRVIWFLLRITKILSSRATLQDLHQKTKIEEKAKTSSSKRLEVGHLQSCLHALEQLFPLWFIISPDPYV